MMEALQKTVKAILYIRESEEEEKEEEEGGGEKNNKIKNHFQQTSQIRTLNRNHLSIAQLIELKSNFNYCLQEAHLIGNYRELKNINQSVKKVEAGNE